MTGTVQVVFCMDTEGPCADPTNASLLADWPAIDAAMDKLFAAEFRDRHRDAAGGRLTIGWFFLTWTGFTTNPRSRVFGYHAVRDHYLARWGQELREFGDEHCWHYHHPPTSGIGNEWGLEWGVCQEFEAIISRQVLERSWFPASYRAGGTIMTNESSAWVDRWFPIDYSNRAPVTLPGLVDWAPGNAEWSIYQPAPEDFRRAGEGRRRMARSLDLEGTAYRLRDDDIEAAFVRAHGGRHAILSCFDHDYRDIAPRVDEFRARVKRVAGRYPEVEWRYAGPREAVRRALEAPVERRLELDASLHAGKVRVSSTAPLFQSLPWLAVRLRDGAIRHETTGLIRIDPHHWEWIPPDGLDWTEAGFGGSTDLGASATVVITPASGPGSVFFAGRVERHPVHPNSIWEHSKLAPRNFSARASGSESTTDSVAQAIELIRPLLVPGASVLDVGCAAGHAWRALRTYGVDYQGIDSYARGIELGRALLGREGLAAEHLRVLALEDLPPDERYDVVLCLNVLYYQPMYHAPLEIMARAADRALVIRSSFGARTDIRYLPDVLLEDGFREDRSYFNVFGRDEVQAYLEGFGFKVTWHDDRRERERFGGKPEVVGGVELPATFLVAERVPRGDR